MKVIKTEKKALGLKKKALIQIGLVCMVLFMLAIIVSGINTRQAMINQINDSIISNVNTTANEVNSFFNHYYDSGKVMADNKTLVSMVEDCSATGEHFIHHSNAEYVQNMLQSFVDSDEGTAMADYVTTCISNDLLMNDGTNIEDLSGFTVGSREWYMGAVNNNGLYVCSPYIDAVTNKTVTTIALPIHSSTDNNKIIGVFGFDLTLDKIEDALSTCALGEDSQIITLLPSGEVFYSTIVENGEYTKVEDVSSSLHKYLRDASATGITKFDYNGTTYVGAKCEIGDSGWVLFNSVSEKEVYFPATRSNILLSLILLVVWLLTNVLILLAFNRMAITPVLKLKGCADKMSEGVIDIDLKYIEHPTDEIEEFSNSLYAILENSKTQASNLKLLAEGADTNVIVRSEEDVLNKALQTVVGTLNTLAKSILNTKEQIEKGITSYRINGETFEGDYKNLVNGINSIIDAFDNPLRQISSSIEELGKGNLQYIDTEYKGDFGVIVNGVNASVKSVEYLVDDTKTLAMNAVEGKLNKRADTNKYEGEFKTAVSGFNSTLDKVAENTEYYESILDSTDTPISVVNMDGNFLFTNKAYQDAQIEHRDLLSSIESGNLSETLTLENGKIYVSSSVELIIKGILIGYITSYNDVTANVKPSEYSAKETERMVYNLSKLASGNFEFNKEKTPSNEYTLGAEETFSKLDEALMKASSSIEKLVKDVELMSDYAKGGKLGHRINEDEYEGKYRNVVTGVNTTVDALTAPIQEAVEVLNKVAVGDFSAKMESTYEGDNNKIKLNLNATVDALKFLIFGVTSVLNEFANCNFGIEFNDNNFVGDTQEIAKSLHRIKKNIGEVITNLTASAEEVASGSKQLSNASQILSEGSEKQSSSVSQITTAMDSIKEQTVANTKDAVKASEMSAKVMENAEIGNSKMQDMLTAMEDINDASANISKVIKVIDDIAFQTNILALNAAVEAARAGVHGKGFAVVADEVRNLAGKSASAVKDTTELIEGSIAKTKRGTEIATESAMAFEEILNGITDTNTIVSSISEKSKEQEMSILEVNMALEEVNKVVQSNSATAEESSAQSEELYGQASLLNNLVSKFTVETKSSIPEIETKPIIELSLDEFSDKY